MNSKRFKEKHTKKRRSSSKESDETSASENEEEDPLNECARACKFEPQVKKNLKLEQLVIHESRGKNLTENEKSKQNNGSNDLSKAHNNNFRRKFKAKS